MTRLAAGLILLGTLGAAGIFFILGLTVASGAEQVHWEVRGPLWGLAAMAVLLGFGAAWLALRAGRH
jgi:hypothetical protein